MVRTAEVSPDMNLSLDQTKQNTYASLCKSAFICFCSREVACKNAGLELLDGVKQDRKSVV